MINFFKKPYVYCCIFSFFLIAAVAYTLLDAFVIPRKGSAAIAVSKYITTDDETDLSSSKTTDAKQTSTPTITENSYVDDNISIELKTVYVNDTYVYIAEVYADSSFLNTALANETYGTNITAKTSTTAKNYNALLAVNGDYYGANKSGYVIKNGVLYRQTKKSNTEYDDLVIYADGSWDTINEEDVSAQQLLENGVINLLSFGPTLVSDGEIAISTNEEVGKSKSSNPRTAIGIIEEGHYLFVVSDGRTNQSEGLSLYELAQVMKQNGCELAYNLDGGGSSTMYFLGEIVNNPTTSGNKISERAVSDIVYIGY